MSFDLIVAPHAAKPARSFRPVGRETDGWTRQVFWNATFPTTPRSWHNPHLSDDQVHNGIWAMNRVIKWLLLAFGAFLLLTALGVGLLRQSAFGPGWTTQRTARILVHDDYFGGVLLPGQYTAATLYCP